MSTKSCHIKAQIINTALGLNEQSLRFYHQETKLLFENFRRKTETKKLSETWLTENDPTAKLDINCYQVIESKPRKSAEQKSCGAAFSFKGGIDYCPIEFETNIACSILPAISKTKRSNNFCVIYGPQSLKLNQFLVELERTMHFVKSLIKEGLILVIVKWK